MTTFNSSYFNINPKINKLDYIKINKNNKKPSKQTFKQTLSINEEKKVLELVNRDLCGGCDKFEFGGSNGFIGKFI